MALIPLNGGVAAIVDEADVSLILGRTWRAARRPDGTAAAVVAGSGYKGTVELMHRVLMCAAPGSIVDHINGNALDNRRANLRFCTHAENSRNRRRASHNRSGFKGVYLDKRSRKYVAEIVADGRKRYLGCYERPEDAHLAYRTMAEILHGEFARTT